MLPVTVANSGLASRATAAPDSLILGSLMVTAKHAFDLHRALFDGKADWFSAVLFRLILKADGHNTERLRLGFPEHVAAVEEWRVLGDAFFDKHLDAERRHPDD